MPYVRTTVNGQSVEREVQARVLLSDFLRHELNLTGTHVGCEHGVCGACTVLVDDKPVRACLMLAVQASGKSVRTVESLARPGEPLSPVQAAFKRHHALQCGFCTPGILMSLTALLEQRDACVKERAVDALRGHLCRCTGYRNIMAAVEEICAEPEEAGHGAG
ncbi:(2Fe-2S)-binding protein [Dactylosporangium sp. CA-233914]|uniref:(2Fe-2S)-binding protein n=1 Tax=Dactylosporangium sp. CA-233914 TaxID=3239934 RepID=UPI003D8D8B59